MRVEMNGDNKPHKNGDHQVTEDVLLLPDGPTADSSTKSDEDSCEDPPVEVEPPKKTPNESSKSYKDAETISRELLSEALELKPVNPAVKLDALKEQQSKNDANGDANGKESLLKDGKPLIQRRMSLRNRAAPKKYSDDQEAASSSDEVDKDPLATKDPLEIPLGKHSSTVLIRKSPTAAVSMLRSPPKSPVKLFGKVTRPPPELIKAPLGNKISISPATSVTVVPRSKENSASSNKSGYVVVDTQNILKGKSSVPVNSVQASVTVSAVAPSTKATVTKSVTAPASSAASRKPASSNAHTASSTPPDPFESLGQISLVSIASGEDRKKKRVSNLTFCYPHFL